MSSLDMLDILGGIDAAYIDESKDTVQNRKTFRISRWLPALAACAALILMIPVVRNIFRGKGGTDGPPDYLEEVKSLEFNGAYYEVTDIPEVLLRYGLPEKLSPDLAGEHVSYLSSIGTAGYLESVTETDIELLQYAADPCRGVYIVKDNDHCYAAIFCNFILISSDASIELSELYNAYGVFKPEDIVSVTETDWHRDKEKGKSVTDRTDIEEFFTFTCSMSPQSSGEFQAEVFDGIPEDEQQKKHTAFADDCRMIRIETSSGLRFYIEVYPKFGWMYGPGTLSYFRMTPEFLDWFKTRF